MDLWGEGLDVLDPEDWGDDWWWWRGLLLLCGGINGLDMLYPDRGDNWRRWWWWRGLLLWWCGLGGTGFWWTGWGREGEAWTGGLDWCSAG